MADGKRYTAHTKNISLGGMFVECADVIPEQTKIQVRFTVPSQPEPIEVSAEIRWVDRGGADRQPGLGVRFDGLRAREVWALNRFFQT